jgi:hypothetical protein
MARRREPVTGRTVAELVADIRAGLVEGYDCEGDAPRGKLAALKELGDRANARQVKFCPYCAGAFVPESGYEGPCAGCKRAEAAEAERDAAVRERDRLREAARIADKLELGWHKPYLDEMARRQDAEEERDQARDALEQIAGLSQFVPPSYKHSRVRASAIARAALDATAGNEPR